jgi:hypothetical protein
MSTDDKTSILPWLQICLQCIDRAAKCERLCFRTQLMARAGHSLNVRGSVVGERRPRNGSANGRYHARNQYFYVFEISTTSLQPLSSCCNICFQDLEVMNLGSIRATA